MTAAPQLPEGHLAEQLQERICELETENGNLRELEETLQRNVRLFNALLNKSQDGILLVTPHMTCLRLVHSVLDNSETDILGQSILTWIHPEDAASVREVFWQLMSGPDRTAACEFRVHRGDRTWEWMAVQMTDMLDDPDVQAIVFNSRSVTKLKEYTERAQTLESYRGCPEYAMFSKSLGGTILDWSPGAQAVYGYRAEEIVGQNISLLLPAGFLEEECSAREKIANGAAVPQFVTVRTHRNGHNIAVRLNLAPIWDAQGRVRAIAHLSHVAAPPTTAD